MKSKMNFSLDNFILFRYLFCIFLVTVPFINDWWSEFSSLYVLTVIFLGLGFFNKPKIFLILLCSLVVLIRAIIAGELENPTAVFIRFCIYLIVIFISTEGTRRYYEVKKHQTELIITLAKSLDSRDPYTANHSENVANYALTIAQEMNLSKKECDAIHIGGLLHDIGKIGIPEHILTKPGKLTDEEYNIIKSHPEIGYEMIKHVSNFDGNGILDIVLYHHERYDGKGYPKGLKGPQIPLVARIVAIADTFDAMTSKRIYRQEIDLEYTLNEIRKNKGTQFDPEVTDVFLSLFQKEK